MSYVSLNRIDVKFWGDLILLEILNNCKLFLVVLIDILLGWKDMLVC